MGEVVHTVPNGLSDPCLWSLTRRNVSGSMSTSIIAETGLCHHFKIFLSPPYILDSQLKNLFFNTALKWTVLGFTSDSNKGFDSDLIWRESCRTWSCMLSVESVRFSCSLESVRLKLFDLTWGRTELGENEWSRLIRGSAPKVSSILFVMGFLKSFGVDIWTFLLFTVDLPKPSTSIVSKNFNEIQITLTNSEDSLILTRYV